MQENNYSAKAVNLVVEVLQPIWEVSTDGLVAVMIWMPPGASAMVRDRMETETVAFISKLNAARDAPL